MFHLIHTDIAPPAQMNDPFCYEPHPLCLLAAEEVKAHLATLSDWADELAAGKMMGVLVCRDSQDCLGFLAAYSGQVLGRADWPWFVPAVFDYLQPDGYFRQEEQQIVEINRQIALREQSSELQSLQAAYDEVVRQGEAAIAAFKEEMRQAKARRDQLRGSGSDAELIRESQFQKAELRRMKKRWSQKSDEARSQLQPLQQQLAALHQERRQRSDDLQRWLFDHFLMRNAQGQSRSLTDIFSTTPQRVPPSGSGECCAPKLLQYAFLHGLQPLCMAEFWQGRSPRMEIRHHDHFYTACRGKCKPILEWMLGLSHEPITNNHEPITINPLWSDDDVVVINKPSGLLSVPGKSDDPSVQSLLRAHYNKEVFMPHRLDMDTSGLMVVALNMAAYHHLQRQFLEHRVRKTYVALLEKPLSTNNHEPITNNHPPSTITLPLRPDPLDRPRQVVDFDHGKPAQTGYEVMGVEDGHTRIRLMPRTGRTHQLRVHCAHPLGLNNPIMGDPLYGTSGPRLCLHATTLSFIHPVSGKQMHFTSPPPF